MDWRSLTMRGMCTKPRTARMCWLPFSATAEELLKEYKACESPDYISYVCVGLNAPFLVTLTIWFIGCPRRRRGRIRSYTRFCYSIPVFLSFTCIGWLFPPISASVTLKWGLYDGQNKEYVYSVATTEGSNYAFFGPSSFFPISEPEHGRKNQTRGHHAQSNVPRTFTPSVRSSLPRIWGFGMALLDS